MTPGQVPPGFVVRVKMSSSICYTSKRLTRDAAESLANDVRSEIADSDDYWLTFPAADYEDLSVVAEAVKAIEVRRVGADGGLYPAPASEPSRHSATLTEAAR